MSMFTDKKHLLAKTMLYETTTIGVRELEASRVKFYRETREINTPLGKLRTKISKMGDEIVRITPEYEDVKRLAKDNDISLLKAYEIVNRLSRN